MMSKITVGIIGGTGLEDVEFISDLRKLNVSTPYGPPSSPLLIGTISGVDVVLLSRHGADHSVSPSTLNYRANIWALRAHGCTHVLVTTACGSLREGIAPGEIVVIDQFIDRTRLRATTFYDGITRVDSDFHGVAHVPMGEPFCRETRNVLIETMKELGIKFHSRGTAVTIEGPRFSTRAESQLFASWGADVVNMTTVPEACLAREAGLSYAALALPTDYDSWRESEHNVTVDEVLRALKTNAHVAKRVLLAALPKLAARDWGEVVDGNRATAKAAVCSG